MFEAMLAGWAAQQLSRRLAETTIKRREWAVRRFAAFTNEYPWRWGPGDLEDFTAELRSGDQPRAASTIRGYHVELGLFLGFVCDQRYGWVGECEERFGTHPVQICTEWNTTRHVTDYEGDPRRRPLTATELQDLFDHADAQVARIGRFGSERGVGMLGAAQGPCDSGGSLHLQIESPCGTGPYAHVRAAGRPA